MNTIILNLKPLGLTRPCTFTFNNMYICSNPAEALKFGLEWNNYHIERPKAAAGAEYDSTTAESQADLTIQHNPKLQENLKKLAADSKQNIEQIKNEARKATAVK